MSHQHDPVSALKEEDATGETAVLFDDIRSVMQIPMLTSIWRILASSLEELRATWQLTKPLFETGYPDAVFNNLTSVHAFPVPPPLISGQLHAKGLTSKDIERIRFIIDAYTRSNTLNMIALTAIVVDPAGTPAESNPTSLSLNWPPLPPVLTESDMASSTWSLIHALNAFGATPDEPGLATLWRHLAHWPEFLAIVYTGFAPLQENEEIQRSINTLLEDINTAGQKLAHHRSPSPMLSPPTHTRIARYVQHPGLVARMVVIGLGLSAWLDSSSAAT